MCRKKTNKNIGSYESVLKERLDLDPKSSDSDPAGVLDLSRIHPHQCVNPWTFGTDPDPGICTTDQRIRIQLFLVMASNPRCQNISFFSLRFFCLLIFEGTFTSVLKDKKL
jgi:hypothetical protein